MDNERFALPLEIAAQGKLFNVVVDNENTARLLLQRKCFDTKVFMIPMNKIQSKGIPENALKQIYETYGNDAKLALDLIKYDKKYESTMQFIFGSTLICSTSQICQKIAYNKSFGIKCVNMEGDIFDPNGTMSGGSMPNKESILMKVTELNFYQSKVQEIKLQIVNLKNELNEINEASKI